MEILNAAFLWVVVKIAHINALMDYVNSVSIFFIFLHLSMLTKPVLFGFVSYFQ